ncbi:uncharacterized protein TNCV_191781 [Trichonephila clavipes]|nr:uncharacterized protein TNCV_191781 [Trichonephila clavipes]
MKMMWRLQGLETKYLKSDLQRIRISDIVKARDPGLQHWTGLFYLLGYVYANDPQLDFTRTETLDIRSYCDVDFVAAVAEWYRYRTVACFVTGSSPVPLKTRRVGQRCTLNLSRAETSSRWCGVVVRRGGASSGVVHVT